MIRLTFLSTLAFFSAQISVAQESSKLVESLDIQGNRRLKDKDLLAHIVTRPGARFDPGQVQGDLASLLKLKVFDPLKTRVIVEKGMRGGVNVIFEVKELPLIKKISFSVSDGLSISGIKEELRKHDALFVEGQPYHSEDVSKVRKIIIRYLAKNNYPDSKILFFLNQLTATTVEVHISIQKPKG